jgi:hypothetical protein
MMSGFRILLLACAGGVALLAGIDRWAGPMPGSPISLLAPAPAHAEEDGDDDAGDDAGGDDGGGDGGGDGGDTAGGDDGGGDDGGGAGDDGGDDAGDDRGDDRDDDDRDDDDRDDDDRGDDDRRDDGADDGSGRTGGGANPPGAGAPAGGRAGAGAAGPAGGLGAPADAAGRDGRDGVFEGPPGGEFVADEIVLLAPGAAALERLAGLGFGLRQRETLEGLGVAFARLGLPPGLDVDTGLAIARGRAPGSVVQANFGYDLAAAPCDNPGCYGWTLLGWAPPPPACGRGVTVGVIDTAVDAGHPALRGRTIRQRSFRSVGIAAPSRHGTAVASIIAGDASSGFPGMLPDAAILAAEVFHVGLDGRVRATATDVASALDWLAREGVPVANVSMAGPDNPLLARAVRRLAARGTVLVAAAGNNGPAAPPAYPAGYDEVVAVTAVDRHRRPYRLANRGPHLAFAAPGVEVWAAAGGDEGGVHTGTSFAAAYATAIVADAVASRGLTGRARVEARLAAAAVDLGAPGRDPVFGAGLVQADALCRE